MLVSSHLYCITTWSQTSQLTIKPIISLKNQTITNIDIQPMRLQHCHILEEHNMFCFESCMSYPILKCILKCPHGDAPFLLYSFVSRHQHTSTVNTQASINTNCCIALQDNQKTYYKHKFMVSIATFKSSIQHAVNFVNDGPFQVK